jgi:hypothetical protein
LYRHHEVRCIGTYVVIDQRGFFKTAKTRPVPDPSCEEDVCARVNSAEEGDTSSCSPRCVRSKERSIHYKKRNRSVQTPSVAATSVATRGYRLRTSNHLRPACNRISYHHFYKNRSRQGQNGYFTQEQWSQISALLPPISSDKSSQLLVFGKLSVPCHGSCLGRSTGRSIR